MSSMSSIQSIHVHFPALLEQPPVDRVRKVRLAQMAPTSCYVHTLINEKNSPSEGWFIQSWRSQKAVAIGCIRQTCSGVIERCQLPPPSPNPRNWCLGDWSTSPRLLSPPPPRKPGCPLPRHSFGAGGHVSNSSQSHRPRTAIILTTLTTTTHPEQARSSDWWYPGLLTRAVDTSPLLPVRQQSKKKKTVLVLVLVLVLVAAVTCSSPLLPRSSRSRLPLTRLGHRRAAEIRRNSSSGAFPVAGICEQDGCFFFFWLVAPLSRSRACVNRERGGTRQLPDKSSHIRRGRPECWFMSCTRVLHFPPFFLIIRDFAKFQQDFLIIQI
ncbi:hypothetical protein BGW80DRAFT_48969 [Lactifluus volemus]|nr:hypothetical protein BGW80DRAFT_48969 [Lactifluus volemus]